MTVRARDWIRSDLVGIPITLGAAGLVVIAVVAFYVGPVTLVVAVPTWGLGLYLAARGSRASTDITDLGAGPGDRPRRILVVADRGLESPTLCDEVHRRARGRDAEVMVLAPVVASSALGEVADDIDAEATRARERVAQAVAALRNRGIRAHGHVDDEAEPMGALLDGLREFPADLVLLPDAGRAWERAKVLADRVRRETGIPVVAVDI